MNILVFEDSAVTRLFPVTIGRPAYRITCATYRLMDLLAGLNGSIKTIVRPYLRPVERLEYPSYSQPLDTNSEWTLVVNARLVPSVSNIQKLQTISASGKACLVRDGENATAAAVVPTEQIANLDDDQVLAALEKYFNSSVPEEKIELGLMEYPHQVVGANLDSFDENMNFRINRGDYREIAEGVFVSGQVTVSDFVVTNTKSGPIVIEDGSVIGPFCFLRGPIHIGRNCRINEHSAIKDQVSICHTVKVGGEVEGSIIEPFSNKQHHGFLGHSYLGSWINLGAGTCNSDLKNTYGEVNMIYDGVKTPTGMQFVGCIMGDYAKSAINTSIFTGKLIGAGSMLYGFVTTNVPSFVNYARSFGQITESPPGILELTQRRMFERRNVLQRPEDIQLIRDMYEVTRTDRQISEEPLTL